VKYRPFGKLDWQVSALGFGAMRLPVLDNDNNVIDEELATRMVRYAIDHGVNYVDTAYTYHGGQSESFLGRALQDGYRQRVKLATKLPIWLVQQADDFDRYLDEQLERLQTDHIDCYLLHNLKLPVWRHMRDLSVLPRAEKALSDGRIGYLGFSFHDRFEVFQQILGEYAGWTFCQIQYNFMDVDYQAGMRGLKYAAAKGLAVVVMEPVRGGRLAHNVPPVVQAIWDLAPVRRTPADWALQWVWNQPEVAVALSGMSAMEHVVENVKAASEALPASLNPADLDLFERVREAYKARTVVDCTECRYCMPCPQGINIPLVFSCRNDAALFDDLEGARRGYGMEVGLNHTAPATACVECGQCEEACTQKIEIIKELAAAVEVLGRPEPGPPPAL